MNTNKGLPFINALHSGAKRAVTLTSSLPLLKALYSYSARNMAAGCFAFLLMLSSLHGSACSGLHLVIQPTAPSGAMLRVPDVATDEAMLRALARLPRQEREESFGLKQVVRMGQWSRSETCSR